AHDDTPSANWFPYQRPVRTGAGDRAVLPDVGSLRTQSIVTDGPDRPAQERAVASRGAGLRDAGQPSRGFARDGRTRPGLMPPPAPA
ncbi:hypothetical protein, partial [Leadbetterella sp. DM7]|uniref:hypothetical protein n=1 Tax=Leadbetterella sp. DM7 TaxID=3235085 RepID=UPI00349EBBEE